MFLSAGYLSAWGRAPALLLALAAFATGLAAGTGLRPFLAAPDAASAAPPASDVMVTASIPAAATALRGRYAAEVLRIVDGDTFQARVSVWPGVAITTRVRLRGIDTPELHARCSQERAQAEAARAALTKILAQGDVEISGVTIDKFGGRVDANASTPTTPDISAALLRAGLGRRYGGGHRLGWCS
jgi:endonuclease YncB( thermonuclease family)